MEDYS
jgi:hypothetical protein